MSAHVMNESFLFLFGLFVYESIQEIFVGNKNSFNFLPFLDKNRFLAAFEEPQHLSELITYL